MSRGTVKIFRNPRNPNNPNAYSTVGLTSLGSPCTFPVYGTEIQLDILPQVLPYEVQELLHVLCLVRESVELSLLQYGHHAVQPLHGSLP